MIVTGFISVLSILFGLLVIIFKAREQGNITDEESPVQTNTQETTLAPPKVDDHDTPRSDCGDLEPHLISSLRVRKIQKIN